MIELADFGNRFIWASCEHRADFDLSDIKLQNGKNMTYTILNDKFKHQMFQNYLMDNTNSFLKRLIEETSHENIYFMYANSKNAENLLKTAVLLSGDGTHKMIRTKQVTLPFTLWLDVNYRVVFTF